MNGKKEKIVGSTAENCFFFSEEFTVKKFEIFSVLVDLSSQYRGTLSNSLRSRDSAFALTALGNKMGLCDIISRQKKTVYNQKECNPPCSTNWNLQLLKNQNQTHNLSEHLTHLKLPVPFPFYHQTQKKQLFLKRGDVRLSIRLQPFILKHCRSFIYILIIFQKERNNPFF
jgi:hypothetical protein